MKNTCLQETCNGKLIFSIVNIIFLLLKSKLPILGNIYLIDPTSNTNPVNERKDELIVIEGAPINCRETSVLQNQMSK